LKSNAAGGRLCANPRILPNRPPSLPAVMFQIYLATCSTKLIAHMCARQRRWRWKYNKGTVTYIYSRCGQVESRVTRWLSQSFTQSASLLRWPEPSQAVEREISFVWWTEVNEQWSRSTRWRWCHMTRGGAASGCNTSNSTTDWWQKKK